MLNHPDLMAIVAKQHAQQLIDEASRHRLARALRRGRRQHLPDTRRPASAASGARPAGRLASCELLPGQPVTGQAR